jgi:iron complex transport system ATP-binding protein
MLTVKELSYTYALFGLKEISISIPKGCITSLIGPNGSGKSTLLRLIARLLKPQTGEIVLDGQSIFTMKAKELACKMGMLPQLNEHRLDLTVLELAQLGRRPHLHLSQRLSEKDHRVVQKAIAMTQLNGFEHRFVSSLSGGERQRAWIAMLLAQEPQVLLLDEPTTYLDIAHQLELLELIRTLNVEQGLTVVMVLHDVNQAAQYSDRILVLNQGQIVDDGPPHKVLTPALFHNVFGVDVRMMHDDGVPLIIPRLTRRDKNKYTFWKGR